MRCSLLASLLVAPIALLGCDGSAIGVSPMVNVERSLTADLPRVGQVQTKPAVRRGHASEPAGSRSDPLFAGRRIRITGKLVEGGRGLAGRESPRRRLAPAAANRIEKSPAARGGVNPCDRPDPGYGIYSKWQYRAGFGKHLAPQQQPVDEHGRFDFIAHFHGAELARLEYVRGQAPIVFLAVKGTSAGYPAMTGRHALSFLISDLEKAMRRDSPTGEAHAEHVALAAWSGGYAAIGNVLRQSDDWERIDAVILLDGLHAPREVPSGTPRLPHFANFARRAAAGEAFFFISYSSIPTDDHASTTEAARLLLREVGGHPVRVEGDGPGGMELKEAYSVGGLHARGYKGGGRLDHCAHLLLYPEVAAALYRYWYPDAG